MGSNYPKFQEPSRFVDQLLQSIYLFFYIKKKILEILLLPFTVTLTGYQIFYFEMLHVILCRLGILKKQFKIKKGKKKSSAWPPNAPSHLKVWLQPCQVSWSLFIYRDSIYKHDRFKLLILRGGGATPRGENFYL